MRERERGKGRERRRGDGRQVEEREDEGFGLVRMDGCSHLVTWLSNVSEHLLDA